MSERADFGNCEACELPRACAGVRQCAKQHGQDDALRSAAQRIAEHNVRLRSFLLRLLDPEDLGHAVTPEVRELARALTVMPRKQ